MSILIKGMEMPKSCDMCWALDDYGDYPRCRITQEQRGYNFPVREQRMGNCPLIPVPEHGRLIDADALMAEDRQIYRSDGAAIGRRRYIELYEIDDAPTIIPADPAKEGEG